MLGCFTWLQSPSNPANDIVDPSYLVVSVDVHTHLPETDRLRKGDTHREYRDRDRIEGTEKRQIKIDKLKH